MTSTKLPLVWEMLNETGEVVLYTYQTVEEFCKCVVEQVGMQYVVEMLCGLPHKTNPALPLPEGLLPPEMIDSATTGVWGMDGLRFVHEGREYLVRCRGATEEEIAEEVRELRERIRELEGEVE